jgi:hypothetical protein
MYTTGWSSGNGAAENLVERPVARDTVTVSPSGTTSVIFRASNPGDTFIARIYANSFNIFFKNKSRHG